MKSYTVLRGTLMLAAATLLLGWTPWQCNFSSLFSTGPGTPSTTYPGNIGVLGMENYSYYGCPEGDLVLPSGQGVGLATNDAINYLSNVGWNIPVASVEQTNGNNVVMDQTGFFNYFGSADNAILVLGHGETGTVFFQAYCSTPSPFADTYWGVGSINPVDGNSLNLGSMPSSNVSWMFLMTSDTVAPDSGMDPGDAQNGSTTQWVANKWTQLFYQSTVPLRGIYGYWQGPGSCPDYGFPTRACDLSVDKDDSAITTFLSLAYPNSGSSTKLAAAWQQANVSAGMDTRWSEIYDVSAQNDYLTADVAALPGRSKVTLNFRTPATLNTPAPTTSVSPSTSTLSPVQLVNESLNVAGGVSSADSSLSLGAYTTSTLRNGVQTVFHSSSGLQVNYYQGLSGGVTYHGDELINAMSFNQSTAQTGALAFVQNTFGLPGDAVLSDVIPIFVSSNGGGGWLQTGYEFVWKHSSGTSYGGDAIKVLVEDYHYLVSETCQKYEYDPPLKPICIQEKFVYGDVPDISYGYRLWRSYGSGETQTQSGYRYGVQTMDAYTASLSTPEADNISSYSLGYWTGTIDQNPGMAEPAWIFRSANGLIYAVDAGSGALLGSQAF